MTDERESLRDDIAFLRELARDDAADLAREGSNMIVVGLVFGAVTFTYWLVFAGYVAPPPAVVSWLWAVGVAIMILVHMLLNRGAPPERPHGRWRQRGAGPGSASWRPASA